MGNILLETGTGEVELIEFIVNQQYYAINVLKVRSIVKIENMTQIPQASSSVIGMTNIRGEIHTVVDLQEVLGKQKVSEYTDKLGLLCEFNGTTVVFLVEKIQGIVKVHWEEIKQMKQDDKDLIVVGNILKEDKIITLLDFEAITIAIGLGEGYQRKGTGVQSSVKKSTKIVLVEDSKAIREMLKCALGEGGYEDITVFTNGKEAYDYIFALKHSMGENFKQQVNILITDIEMPILDGYTLTRKIKEDEILKALPVVIFSSLITEELKHKGEAVGADVQIGKPSINELVKIVEEIAVK